MTFFATIVSAFVLLMPTVLFATEEGFLGIDYDIFKNSVGPWLPPGSSGRLSLLAHGYQGLSGAVLQRFKTKDRFYDLEALYDAYHSIDDEFEKISIKRLILSQLPDIISDCYETQHNYEECKRNLFTGDHMSYQHISDSFPTLSRMLLKHKDFIYNESLDPEPFGGPVLIEYFINSLDRIGGPSLLSLFSRADPAKLRPAFALLQYAEPQFVEVLQKESFDFLVDSDELVDPYTALYAISHASEENMDKVIKLIGRMSGFLTKFVPNFVKYPHLKPITLHIISHDYKDLATKDMLVPEILGCPEFDEYYAAIRGNHVIDSLKFLKSFEGGSFEAARPDGVSTRELVETAFIYDFPEDALQAIISMSDFVCDFSLIDVALNSGVTTKIISSIFRVWGEYPAGCPVGYSSIKKPISMGVFKILAENARNGYLRRTPDKGILGLVRRILKSIPHHQYLHYILNYWSDGHFIPSESLSQLVFSKTDIGGGEMVMEAINYCFKYQKHLKWRYPSTPKQVREFLEAQTTEDLITYEQQASRECLCSFSSGKNSVTACISVLGSRADGYEYLMNRYKDSAFLSNIPIVSGKLEPKDAAMALLETGNPFDFFSLLEILPQRYAEKILRVMCELPASDRLDGYLLGYIKDSVQRQVPVTQIPVMKYITLKRFKRLTGTMPLFDLFGGRVDWPYYYFRLRSDQFFKREDDTPL